MSSLYEMVHSKRVHKAKAWLAEARQALSAEAMPVKTVDNLVTTINAGDRTSSMYSRTWAQSKEQQLKSMIDWVWAAVDAIASKVAETKWELYYDRGDRETIDESDRLYDMFRKPSLNQSFYDFSYLFAAYNRLVGETHVHAYEINPLELKLLRPDRISHCQGHWQYNNGPNSRVLTPGVDYWKSVLPDVMHPDGNAGYSPVRAIAGILQSYTGMRVAEFSTFRQSVINQLLLRLADDMGVEAQKKLSAQLRQHLGSNSAGRTIGAAGITGVDRVGLSPKDIVNPDMARNFRREILATFKTPESILGLGESSNRATSYNDRYNFVEQAVRPLLIMMQLFFNQQVLPALYTGKLVRCRPIVPYPDNEEEIRAQEAHDLTNNIRTINEVRIARGLEEVEWGSVPLVAFTTGPLMMSSPSEPGADLEQRLSVPAIAKTFHTKRQMQFQTSFERIHAVWERKFITEADAKVFGPLRAYLLHELEPGKGVKELRWDVAKAAEAMQTLYDSIVIEGAAKTYAEVIADAFELDFNLSAWRTAFAEFYQRRGQEFWVERLTAGRVATEAAIGDAAAGTITASDAAGVIEREYGRVRAQRIARTEITGAMNGGATRVYSTTGIERKEWITTLDEVTRETHAMVNGDVVPVDAAFSVGGNNMQHPGDPSAPAGEIVNCRCSVAPVVG